MVVAKGVFRSWIEHSDAQNSNDEYRVAQAMQSMDSTGRTVAGSLCKVLRIFSLFWKYPINTRTIRLDHARIQCAHYG